MRREWLARSVIIFGVLVALGIPGISQWQRSRGIVVHASMAESGGWSPGDLTIAVGEPLHLRLTSDDVTHGFAVGQLNQPAVDIIPGEMTDITLVFTKPGKYTFYCTRWCSLNHWRMRGTIEVTGPQTTTETVESPLYVRLGLNIDADHQASPIPAQMPSAQRGALLNQSLPGTYMSREYYLSHTPQQLWSSLRSEPKLIKLTDQQIWDLVAWVWQSNITPGELQSGRQLFTSNCTACHGESGAANGVFANQLAAGSNSADENQTMGEHTQRPANFTDPVRMLSASPAHLQGKIIRGGMGTGMPSWGAIFTEDQTLALVAYLWTYQFQLEVGP